MKYAPLALFTLALAAATAWPLARWGTALAAPAGAEATLQPACAPQTSEAQPEPHALALPPGHPPVDLRRFLPPGHPPIAAEEGAGALPPGHPELPPGHPPIPSSPRGMPLPFLDEPVIHEI
jgi:hypothetical protein